MLAFQTLLLNVIIFALLIIPGYILGKQKLLKQSSLTCFANVLMYVGMPFLVFATLLKLNFRTVSVSSILISVGASIFAVLVTVAIGKLCFRGESGQSRVCVFCSSFSNCGFMGIPLSQILFPEHPEITLYVSLFNVGCTCLLLTMGTELLSGEKPKQMFKSLCCSPILISVLLGLAASAMSLCEKLPCVITYAEYLANLTTPLSMLVLGVELSLISLTELFKSPKAYAVYAFKLILCPVLTVGVFGGLLLLFDLPDSIELIVAIFLATSVPTAASAPALAKKYGVDGKYAGILTLGTTVWSVFTLPLLYFALSAIIR